MGEKWQDVAPGYFVANVVTDHRFCPVHNATSDSRGAQVLHPETIMRGEIGRLGKYRIRVADEE